jgi:uncharacterized protein
MNLRIDGSVFFIDSADYILKVIDVEIAETKDAITNGLMRRKPLTDKEGMLFIFDSPQKVDFWMKDVYFPLDMIFINSDKKIIRIEKECEPFSSKLISSFGLVLYVIEVNGGFCDKFGIDTSWKIMYRKGVMKPDK